jgi:hypothetical protein
MRLHACTPCIPAALTTSPAKNLTYIPVFWDVTPYTVSQRYQLSKARNASIFYLKDGSTRFLCNTGTYLPTYLYVVPHPKTAILILFAVRTSNLKYYIMVVNLT